MLITSLQARYGIKTMKSIISDEYSIRIRTGNMNRYNLLSTLSRWMKTISDRDQIDVTCFSSNAPDSIYYQGDIFQLYLNQQMKK